jgi:hypothetical protein
VGIVDWRDAELNIIESREDLARYLVGLAEKIRKGEISIENPATDDFVASAGRWAKSMDGFFNNILREPVPENPDWATVAAIFRAALVYE